MVITGAISDPRSGEKVARPTFQRLCEQAGATAASSVSANTDLLITGRTVDAAEAKALGLVNDVSDDVIGLAMAWARDVADNCAPTAVAVIKGQLLLADVQDLSQAVDSSLAEMRAAFARDDLAEAVMAKIAKRPPAFAPRSAP